MNRIAHIIPVHNRLAYTQECVTILEQQKDTQFYLKNQVFTIVVDDGSTDGTREWLNSNYPETIVLQGNGNLWYSGSLNMGIRYAFEKLACNFINVWENDVIPMDNYFNNLQAIIEQWDGKSLVASKLYYKVHPEIIFSMGGVFNPKTGYKSLIARNKIDGPEFDKPIEVDWFSGQQVLIHKNIIDIVGYFDDVNFPQYHADIDYSLRAKKAGFHNMVYPSLKLLNDSETTGIDHIRNKTLKQFIESLHSIRSNANIIKDFKFYNRHTTSILAYGSLLKRYLVYTGGFIKWKVLGWLGVKRKNEKLF